MIENDVVNRFLITGCMCMFMTYTSIDERTYIQDLYSQDAFMYMY